MPEVQSASCQAEIGGVVIADSLRKEAVMRTLEEARFYGYAPPGQTRSEAKLRLAHEFHVTPRGLMSLLRALERETRARQRANPSGNGSVTQRD
jgi:hypothetical protein